MIDDPAAFFQFVFAVAVLVFAIWYLSRINGGGGRPESGKGGRPESGKGDRGSDDGSGSGGGGGAGGDDDGYSPW